MRRTSRFIPALRRNTASSYYARERVECRLANMRESRHLGIPKGSAILYVERQTFGYRKSRPMELFPVEFVKMSYNAEKYTFHQIIRKE